MTGATGDVGRRLLRILIEKGERPVAFDIAPRVSGIEDILDRITLIEGDVLSLSELVGAMKANKVEKVAHLASMLTADSEARPLHSLNVNVMGSANVFEAAKLIGARRVVYVSTSSVYGETEEDETVDEDHKKEPTNVYGVSKLAAEYYGRTYLRKAGIEYTALRLRIILGAGQRLDTGAMKILGMAGVLDRLSGNEEVVIPYEPSGKLEITHPWDAANAIYLALTVPELRRSAYNIMSGAFAYGEMAGSIMDAWPGSRVVARKPSNDAPKSARKFGRYSIQRAREDLGYEPAYSISRIMNEVVEYERERRRGYGDVGRPAFGKG